MHCSFVAAEASSMAIGDGDSGLSLEEVGEAMNITREGVRLIQLKALIKLRRTLQTLEDEREQALSKSMLHSRGDRISADDQDIEPEDENHVSLCVCRRKLERR